MGEAVKLTEEAWRTLSIRWGVFFLAMAGLNEVVWRSLSTDAWVNFKVFGLLPITLVFALANAPYMTRHMIEDEKLDEDKAGAQ
jgi:intracellular septation protein